MMSYSLSFHDPIHSLLHKYPSYSPSIMHSSHSPMGSEPLHTRRMHPGFQYSHPVPHEHVEIGLVEEAVGGSDDHQIPCWGSSHSRVLLGFGAAQGEPRGGIHLLCQIWQGGSHLSKFYNRRRNPQLL